MARLWKQKAVCWKLLDVWKTRAEFGSERNTTSRAAEQRDAVTDVKENLEAGLFNYSFIIIFF